MTSDLPTRLDSLASRLVDPGPAPVAAIHDLARVRRGRRRRAGGAVAMTVVLLAAAGGLAARAATTQAVANVSRPAPPHAVVEGVPCTSGSHFDSSLFPADGVIPRGATTAYLCPFDNLWQAPRDALTTDVDGLIDMIDAEPVSPPSDFCAPSHGFTEYSVTFTYPDGTSKAVLGEIHGPCGTGLSTSRPPKRGPQTTRQGAQAVLSGYVDGLAAQRARQSPPSSDGLPSGACTREEGALPDSIVGPRSELDLVAGEVCTYQWTPVPHGFAYVLQRARRLTATQVADLDDGFRDHAETIDTSDVDYDVTGLFTTIAGVDRWGDTVTLELLKDGLVREPSIAEPGQAAVWGLTADQLATVLESGS